MSFNDILNFGPQFWEETVVRAEVVYLYTATGRRFLDWTGSQMSCILGHGHLDVAQATYQHAKSLDHPLSCIVSPPVLELAERLKTLTPPDLDKTIFLNTGSESVEAAIRLAKLYTGRFKVVGLTSSWHGMTAGSLAAQSHECKVGSRFHKATGEHDWEAELEYGWELVDQASCGSLCAAVVEPILPSGGMLVLPYGYPTAMLAQCRKRSMLLIVDEAQTSFGRCGQMFAFQREDVVPNILILSKNFGSGFPLSAVMTSSEIAADSERKGFLFCTTHVNDPFTAAIGCMVVNVVIRDGLVPRAARLGVRLYSTLEAMERRYSCIGDVRGRGLMAGVEIVSDRKSKAHDPELARALTSKMSELGMTSNLTTFRRLFRIAPPLTITEKELQTGLDIMNCAFREVLETAKHDCGAR